MGKQPMLRYLLPPFVLLLLVGCQSMGPRGSDAVSVEKVIRALKRDVDQAQHYVTWAALQPALSTACLGRVQFQLVSAKVTLTASIVKSTEVTAGVSVPVGPVTLGPTLTVDRQVLNTQAITFYVYPVLAPTDAEAAALRAADALDKMTPQQIASDQALVERHRAAMVAVVEPPAMDPAQYPITEGLRSLRNGLLAASDAKSCFTMASDDSDKANTLEYGFGVESKSGGSLDVNFLVFSLGAGTSNQAKAANAVEVSFASTGSTFLLAR